MIQEPKPGSNLLDHRWAACSLSLNFSSNITPKYRTLATIFTSAPSHNTLNIYAVCTAQSFIRTNEYTISLGASWKGLRASWEGLGTSWDGRMSSSRSALKQQSKEREPLTIFYLLVFTLKGQRCVLSPSVCQSVSLSICRFVCLSVCVSRVNKKNVVFPIDFYK